MERINDILKPIMGIILLLSFVTVFSSCEKKGGMVENTDTAIIIHKNSNHTAQHDTTNSDNSDWKAKMKAEGDEIEKDLENLKVKAKKAGGKIEKDINQAVDKMKADKDKSSHDTTNSRFKENWEEFKTKTKNAIDSLNKKI